MCSMDMEYLKDRLESLGAELFVNGAGITEAVLQVYTLINRTRRISRKGMFYPNDTQYFFLYQKYMDFFCLNSNKHI